LVVISLLCVLGVSIFSLWYYNVLYIQTPDNIRNPRIAHEHFRLQLIIDSQKIDFSKPPFQEPTPKSSSISVCTIGLTKEPMHFHDKKDQIIHLHWAKITGGQILKYYGLNYVDNNDSILGWQLKNNSKMPKALKTKDLRLGKTKKLWVYTGDENSYQSRNSKDFLNQTIKKFFAKENQSGTDILGNVAVFVQETEPSNQDIQNKFQNLVEYEDGSCGS
jgi:hypothetical protein